MTHPFIGTYCIIGLPFSPNNAVATLGDDFNAGSINLFVGQDFGCPVGTQISIQTFNLAVDSTSGDGTAFFEDSDFYININ